MSLILAIETDKRQAAQLTAMARNRLASTELVLADSAERGFQALGDRIPDLILTPALLSPRDEGVITDHLERLSTRAAHVQTLAVPVLAATVQHGSVRRGMLSVLLGEKNGGGATADGCDPAVFAEQVQAYLDRATIERDTRAAQQADTEEEESSVETREEEADRQLPEAAPAAIDVQAWQADWAVQEIAAAVEEMSAPEPIAPERFLEVTAPPPAFERPAFESAPARQFIEPPQFAEFDLAALLEDFRPAASEPEPPAGPILATRAPAERVPPERVLAEEAVPAASVFAEPVVTEPLVIEPVVTQPLVVETIAFQPATVPPVAIEPAASPEESIMAAVAAVGRLVPDSTGSSGELRLPSLTPEPLPGPPVAAASKAERRKPLPTMKTTAEPPRKKVRRPKPLQDEWGLFDPAQCGFAALVARLEEVTNGGDAADAPRAETAPAPAARGTRVAR